MEANQLLLHLLGTPRTFLSGFLSGVGAELSETQLDGKVRLEPHFSIDSTMLMIETLQTFDNGHHMPELQHSWEAAHILYLSKKKRNRQITVKDRILQLTDKRMEEVEKLGIDWDSRKSFSKQIEKGWIRTSSVVVEVGGVGTRVEFDTELKPQII